MKACAKALTRFPTVNASWTGETIQTHAEVHVGVAVSIPDGLITPVVRNADRKHVVEISREVKDLAARARDKKLKPEEFMGSTFTISNLGMFDVTEFTAIINPPESCILAVGAVRKVPVVKDDQLADRPPHEGDAELRPPRGRRRPRGAVPRRGPPPAGEPGQPAAVAVLFPRDSGWTGPEESAVLRAGGPADSASPGPGQLLGAQRVVMHGTPWSHYEALLALRGEASSPRIAFLEERSS